MSRLTQTQKQINLDNGELQQLNQRLQSMVQ